MYIIETSVLFVRRGKNKNRKLNINDVMMLSLIKIIGIKMSGN